MRLRTPSPLASVAPCRRRGAPSSLSVRTLQAQQAEPRRECSTISAEFRHCLWRSAYRWYWRWAARLSGRCCPPDRFHCRWLPLTHSLSPTSESLTVPARSVKRMLKTTVSGRARGPVPRARSQAVGQELASQKRQRVTLLEVSFHPALRSRSG